MSARETVEPNAADPSIEFEAAAWLGLLRADDRTPEMEHAFRHWLNADPRHRAAFEVANEFAHAASTLPRSIRSRYPSWQQVQVRRRSWQLSAAFAACLLVVSALMFYGLRHRGLETDIGELRTVTLDDGTRVTLNTATRVTVQFEERVRRVRLDAGEAGFEVAKNPHRPFVVRAGDREVTALGTSFVVRLDAARTAVTLVEGKVSVAPVIEHRPTAPEVLAPLRPAAILHPGERLTIATGKPLQLDRPALETVTAWQQGRVVFQQTPLVEALSEMNRYSERKVVVEMPVTGFAFSGIFRAGDQENFALALCETYSLGLRHEGGRIVLMKDRDTH